MKQVLALKGDKELREFFGVAQSTFSSWKNRNSLPAEIFINFANERSVDLNWLLLGKGKRKILPQMNKLCFLHIGSLSLNTK